MVIAQFIKKTVLRTLAFFVLFLPQIVFSASYSAIITDFAADPTLAEISVQLTNTQEIITLQISSEQDKKLLRRLSAGDYIAFQAQRAQKAQKKNTFKLFSIDFVGLKTLLGTWTGDDGLCYDFTRFSQLTVFNQSLRRSCAAPKTLDLIFPKAFKYFITPNDGDWDVLVGDSDVYYTAEFQFNGPNHISAQIFDTETGEIVSELNLWR